MIGSKVIGISGALYPEREGQIIAEETILGRDSYIVAWLDTGKLESYGKTALRPYKQRLGIGVYIA